MRSIRILTMEIKNGIIIDGVLHELVSMRNSAPCDNCSLQEQCETDRALCTVIAGYYNSDERFISRGKVTDIKIEEEKK